MKKIEVKTYNLGESLFSAILFLILGIILFTNPNGVVKTVIYILGGFSILMGVLKLLVYYNTAQYNPNKKVVLAGMLYMLIGTVTLICSIVFFDAIETVLRLGVAIYLLYVGLNRLLSAFKAPKEDKLIYIINSILISGAGVALALIKGLPFKIVGIFIIGYSIVEIIGFFICRFNSKDSDSSVIIKEATILKEEEEKEEQKLLK